MPKHHRTPISRLSTLVLKPRTKSKRTDLSNNIDVKILGNLCTLLETVFMLTKGRFYGRKVTQNVVKLIKRIPWFVYVFCDCRFLSEGVALIKNVY